MDSPSTSSDSLEDVGAAMVSLSITMEEFARSLESLQALFALDFAPDECSPDTSQPYPFEVRMLS